MSLASLNNIRTIRKEAREMEFEVFEEILLKMNQVHEELVELKKEDDAKRAKKQEVIDRLRAMLAEEGIEGITITEEGESVPAASAASNGTGSGRGGKGVKRGPAKAKYEFDTADGKKQWSGRGRMPKDLAAALDTGAKLEDFEIKE